jgi:hypothetical protein
LGRNQQDLLQNLTYMTGMNRIYRIIKSIW